MNSFILNQTEFDIENSSSFVQLKDGLLSIEIRGKQSSFDKITEDENSEWSWTLYPPKFYIHAYPVNFKSLQLSVEFMLEDSEQFASAIYLMEHNSIENVKIKIESSVLHVSGKMSFFGEKLLFSIQYQINA